MMVLREDDESQTHLLGQRNMWKQRNEDIQFQGSIFSLNSTKIGGCDVIF